MVFCVLVLGVSGGRRASVCPLRSAASASLAALLGIFVFWNLGLIFQWGAHLIPARGPVSWREVTHNQFHAVPKQIATQLESYLFRRKESLHTIEERDIEQLRKNSSR